MNVFITKSGLTYVFVENKREEEDDGAARRLSAKNKSMQSEADKVLPMKRVKIRGRDNKFIFSVKELPAKVGIDPYNYLVDRIPDDNVKSLDVN